MSKGDDMSSLIVITFDNPDEAHQVRTQLRELEKQDEVHMEDAAVIMKDEHGKIHVVNETDKTVVKGAVIGGALGLLVMFMFPVAGIALGAAGGALVAGTLDAGVDKKFVKQVSEELQPNASALFLLINEANVNATLATLRQHRGKVYQTNLSPELEASLHAALHDTTPTQF
jgi:uncharacterized membrane protein